MLHACSPQWRKVWVMACCPICTSVPVTPGRGLAKWLSGSATPQKTRPMPMPAAKSRANQDMVENSGLSSSLPRRMSP